MEAHNSITSTINLDYDQRTFLSNFQKHNICLLTGYPGSGKTQCIRIMCELLDAQNVQYVLCAPTGKATKRMSELTGKSAKTIHRLLGANIFGDWKYNKDNKLGAYKYVILDEVSMLDLEVFYRLLQAFPLSTHFIFVGDVYQLPSVGPGTVLRDMINCKKIPSYFLSQNHRQLKGSLIAQNAKKINTGDLKLTFSDDFKFVEKNNIVEIRESIPTLIEELSKDYDLIQDVQVLSPQHNTQVGVGALNEMLRFSINKRARPSEKFSVGDKVIQMQNNYKLKIFNGYIGIIESIDYYNYNIRFFDADDTKLIKYPKNNIYELSHAFCCTIHKFQGSEAKAGIIIVCNSHIYMWSRELIYTAITRFKEKCIIVGDYPTFKKAIITNNAQVRYSRLSERLQGVI